MGTIGMGDGVINMNGPFLNQMYGGTVGPDYGYGIDYGYGNGRSSYTQKLGGYFGAFGGGDYDEGGFFG